MRNSETENRNCKSNQELEKQENQKQKNCQFANLKN